MATLESAYGIKANLINETLIQFSEQQLIDCSSSQVDPAEPNEGCYSGNMYDAMHHWMKHTALLTSEYPYTAREGSCKEKLKESTSASPVKSIHQRHRL